MMEEGPAESGSTESGRHEEGCGEVSVMLSGGYKTVASRDT